MRGPHEIIVSETTNGEAKLDLRALRSAILVLELGSFRRAADVLGVQPSIVSRQVRTLEDVIGVGLFHRRTQGAHPTSAGLKVLRHARRLLEEAHFLVRIGRLGGEAREGALGIGIVASIAGGGAHDLLRTFLAKHPSIEINVVERSSAEQIADVRALKLDLAFVVGRPPATGCVLETLWSDPIMVALPVDHPLAQFDVLGWPALHAERFLVRHMDPGPEIQDYIVQHLASLGHRPVIEPCMVGRDGLAALIGLGQGVTLVSGAEAAVSYPGVVYRHLEGEALPVSVVWSEQNDNPILRRFMALVHRWSR